MANKTPIQTQDTVDQEQRRVRAKKNGPETLASGGMSPLVDRKDPSDGAKSAPAAPAAGGDAIIANVARAVTPAEPIGGWVNASTGRGKILVPEKEAAGRVHLRDREEATPAIVVKGKEPADPIGPSKPPETLNERVRYVKSVDEALAEKPGNSTGEAERIKQAAILGAKDDEERDEADEENKS